ncbi:MAG: helix-turn-helix transcriptional regulator [Victivallales bacterium]|nr:helix-turn-helix transcriptional regulator [Victivallales bacterium]
MENTWISDARRLPEPTSYFHGRKLPDGFQLPTNILMYFRDYPHPTTTISTRYMLILPVYPLEYRVSGRVIMLKPGEALLVKPYLQRRVPETGQQYDRLLISFLMPMEQTYLPHQEVFSISEAAGEQIGKMVEFYLAGNTIGALFALTLLLNELGQSPTDSPAPVLTARIVEVLARINSNLVRPLSIKELADEVNMSASHLRRLFREELDISLGEYLAEQRIAGAKQLLEETSLSIGEVALRSGYESIYAFSRFFRNRSGVAPGSYRQMKISSKNVIAQNNQNSNPFGNN